ncbi:MAG: hypothetical protein ACRD3J_09930 [Thermoanaerobaculia bacterium]
MQTVRPVRAKVLLRRMDTILIDFVQACECAVADFGAVEEATAVALDRIRRLLVTAGLTAAVEEVGTFHCPDCLRELSAWKLGPRAIATAQGDGSYPAVRYRCNACGKDHYPVEAANGLEGDQFTTGAKATIAESAADLAYAHVSATLAQSRSISVSAKEVDRTAREVAAWRAEEEKALVDAAFGEKACQARLEGIDPIESTPNLYPMQGWKPDTPALISVDGAKVRSTQKGPEGLLWFECRAGIIAPADDNREARKACVGGIHSPDDLFDRLAAAWLRGDNAHRLCIFSADFGNWIWNRVRFYFPNAIQLLDIYHAGEHVGSAGIAYWGRDSDGAKDWKLRARDMLMQKAGPPNLLHGLMRMLRAGNAADADELRKEFRYLYANRHRMPYFEHHEKGLAVGSGAMESTIKQACINRVRQAGMKWTHQGAHAVLGLRCAKLSGTLAQTTDRKHKSLQEKLTDYMPNCARIAA